MILSPRTRECHGSRVQTRPEIMTPGKRKGHRSVITPHIQYVKTVYKRKNKRLNAPGAWWQRRALGRGGSAVPTASWMWGSSSLGAGWLYLRCRRGGTAGRRCQAGCRQWQCPFIHSLLRQGGRSALMMRCAGCRQCPCTAQHRHRTIPHPRLGYSFPAGPPAPAP